MSNEVGTVAQNSKVIGFVEWQGSSEQLADCRIWATQDEVSAHWRQSGWYTCKCGGKHEDAILILADRPQHWPVTICRKCSVITTNVGMDELYDKYRECLICDEREYCKRDPIHKWRPTWPREGNPLSLDYLG